MQSARAYKRQNTIRMKDLHAMALIATRSLVSTTKSESINEALVRLLQKDGLKLDRVELRARISLDRLIATHTEAELQKLDKEKFLELLEGVSTTVKNGLDTSLSNSQNNSSFGFNPKYKNLNLELVTGKYQITKKSN